ncbi:MAG: hypothetical protein EA376_10530 [Phycisphaeraceae bacterium]|nr:MAG: hypothetical protein EA376_10530 [Phycisphaeraceae bacterium]
MTIFLRARRLTIYMKRPSSYLAGLLVLTLLSSATAMAQRELPGEVVTALRLDAAQEDVVRTFINRHGPELTNEDPRARQQARNALLSPLTGASGDPSAAFRLVYNRHLYGPLRDLEQHEELGVALGALRIAGWLCAENGFLALRHAIRDERPAVRYGAARGMGRSLRLVAEGRSVLPGQRIDEALELLQRRLAEESNVQVLDGVTLALASVPEGDALRGRAMSALVRGAATQIARRHTPEHVSADAEAMALLRVMTYTRDELTRAVAVDRAFTLDAMTLAGHALAYCLMTLEQDPEDDMLRQHVQSLAVTAEATLILGHVVLSNEQLNEQVRVAFERAANRGATQAARNVVMEWIGPEGRLARPPYNIDPDRFRTDAAR